MELFIVVDFGLMNIKQLIIKKFGLFVILEYEEDIVILEKLNECFDKVMIEIFLYLEIS